MDESSAHHDSPALKGDGLDCRGPLTPANSRRTADIAACGAGDLAGYPAILCSSTCQYLITSALTPVFYTQFTNGDEKLDERPQSVWHLLADRDLLAQVCARLPRLRDEQAQKLPEEGTFQEMHQALEAHVPKLAKRPASMDCEQPEMYHGP